MKDNNKHNRKMQLLVLSQLFYPELVSTGQTLTELCEELSDMGVEIEVYASQPTILKNQDKVAKNIVYRGIKIKRLWSTRFPKLNILGRIINQVTFSFSTFFKLIFERKDRPILVLTNPPFLGFSCAFFRMLGVGNPYIYVVFDVYPDTPIKLGVLRKKSLITCLWKKVNKIILKNASEIIVIGRCMQDIMKKKMKKMNIFDPDKMNKIHVWSDDKLIGKAQNKKNPFIKKWKLENKFVVSYSGNMGRFHDMETIMEAAKILKEWQKIIFLFIGEGHKKKWIKDFAETHNLKNCQFHPYVERKKLGYSLSLADIGLVSLCEGQEGLSVPSKTFGILSAGVPVIGIMNKKSEIARILEEESCGIVISPGKSSLLADTICELYENKNYLKKLGENAKKAILNKYNLHFAAKEYYKIIKKY